MYILLILLPKGLFDRLVAFNKNVDAAVPCAGMHQAAVLCVVVLTWGSALNLGSCLYPAYGVKMQIGLWWAASIVRLLLWACSALLRHNVDPVLYCQ